MESSFTTRKDLIKRKASGWYFWGVVVAVAFPGPYGPETGYDPRDTLTQRYTQYGQLILLKCAVCRLWLAA